MDRIIDNYRKLVKLCLSQHAGQLLQVSIGFRQTIQTALCTTDYEECSARMLREGVDSCLPENRLMAIWTLVHLMQHIFEMLFKDKHHDLRKYRWMKLFAHLSVLEQHGKRIIQHKVISQMLWDVTREATCEDIKCIRCFCEIWAPAADGSDDYPKKLMDSVFRVLSEEITDSSVKDELKQVVQHRPKR